MIRLVACLLWLALESFVSIIFEGARLWLLVKPYKRIRNAIRQRRTRKAMQSWHDEHGGPPDETLEDFNTQPDEVSMDALKGAVRSKLVWLGVAQILYGLVQLWADGMLAIESAGPVIGGAVTVWLRAITKESLADKAKP